MRFCKNMNNYAYKNQEIYKLLNQLKAKRVSGVLYFESEIKTSRTLSSLLVWKQGGIVYGGLKLLSGQEIVKKMLQKFNPKMTEAALKFVLPKLNKSSSARQFMSLIVKLRILSWKQIETYIQTQVASIIEQLFLSSGTAKLITNQHFDLSFGEDEHSLNWSNLSKELKERRNKWQTLSPEIPAPNSIPEPQLDQLGSIPHASIRNHIEKWVDGKHSFIEIAAELNQDPLNIARSYHNWVQSGWIKFKNDRQLESQRLNDPTSTTETSIQSHNSDNLLTVLSVDDSLIVQTSIKRALEDHYQVMLSDNATDALNILNKNKIDLLLLDVTMPDINGLDMCIALRTIPKFKHLPIVMVTARDSFSDKMKGKIAGTNHYLTKPFEKDKLLEVIDKLITKAKTSHTAKVIASK